jgi:hypothetical protein
MLHFNTTGAIFLIKLLFIKHTHCLNGINYAS